MPGPNRIVDLFRRFGEHGGSTELAPLVSAAPEFSFISRVCMPAHDYSKPEDQPDPVPSPDEGWEDYVAAAVEKAAAENVLAAKFYLEMRQFERRLSALEAVSLSGTITINTLVGYGLNLKKAIPVMIQSDGEEFAVSFVEANIGASGETLSEAIEGLKDSLATSFNYMRQLPPDRLGPAPTRQLAVLREFIGE